MTTLNLTNQQTAVTAMAPYITGLKDRMEQRKVIWDKLPIEKKKQWVKSGKDPIMTLAYNTFKYLRDGFFSDTGVE